MAHVYKPVIIRYVAEDGKRVRKGTPGAKKVRTRSKVWRGKFRDRDGRLHDVKLCTDKSAAQAMLQKHVVNADRCDAGLDDPHEKLRGKPLLEHLDDYRRYLEAKENTADHVDLTISRIRAIAEGCEFQRLRDLSGEAVLNWLSELRQGGSNPGETVTVMGTAKNYREIADAFGVAVTTVAQWRRSGAPIVPHQTNDLSAIAVWRNERIGTGGVSPSTSNHYLRAIKSFGGWLVKTNRLDANPIANLSALNTETDIRRPRRSLSADQFEALIAAAKASDAVFRGLDGYDRAMLYLLAANTGLRVSELASLKLQSLDFEAPAVIVKAAYSKRRKAERQPLRRDIAVMLQQWVGRRGIFRPQESLWPGTWSRDAAAMLRGDLEDAGIEYVDDSGQYFDFHALRHQFISNLAKAGVHPKVAQELARHSSIQLTMDRYTHVDCGQLTEALENLPSIGIRGTTELDGGEEHAGMVASLVAPAAAISRPEVAAADIDEGCNRHNHEINNTLVKQGFDASCRGMSPPDKNRHRRVSNPRRTDCQSARKRVQHDRRHDHRGVSQTFGRTDCPSYIKSLISLLDSLRPRVQESVPRRL